MKKDPKEQQLDPCGCCEAEVPPVSEHENRPGQPELNYRIGTHSSFLRRMLARLPNQPVPDGPNEGTRPLTALTARSPDDPAVALLDVWATAADVLTFYQESIANEGYLRTATERRSVLELARAIGCELNPGVAANTYLVFTVEDAPGAPQVAKVPKGTQVQSIPTPPALPQTFETSEEIEARAERNELKPMTSQRQSINGGLKQLYLKGINTNLKPGDALLLVGEERGSERGSERWDFRILQSVTAYPDMACTLVTWKEGLGHEDPYTEPAQNPNVYCFRTRASIFGHNAPDWRAMSNQIKKAYYSQHDNWPEIDQIAEQKQIHLDAVYPGIIEGSWIVIAKPGQVELYKAESVEADSQTNFTLTAKTTRIELDTNEHLDHFSRRNAVVFAESEKLELAERPLSVPLPRHKIELDRKVEGLAKGQVLILSGKRMGSSWASMIKEVIAVDEVDVSEDGERTVVIPKDRLENDYDPATVTIYGNVAAATHGETVNEILGSGDGARANQEFKLRKPPLTYVSAKNPKGTDSTLEVRVNGLLWKEVSSFYGLEPQSESYIVRHEDDGTARVIFGDGESGARLPTGMENVTATYRSGIGFDGQLDADSLTLLKTRPFGIREVTNPIPTSGADAPEKLADARINAPRTALTFDRIVSLKDFEDFARDFAGIGKAQAVSLWNGQANVVHITVALASGEPIGLGDKTYDDLLDAIKNSCEPTQTFHVDDYTRMFFCVDASIRIDYPRFEKEEVRNRVEGVFYKAFSFEQRSLGQPITAAEIITVIHGVPGVVAVDLNKLYENTDPSGPEQTTAPPVLPADRTMMATWDRQFYPAQLLMLKPDGLTLKERSEP